MSEQKMTLKEAVEDLRGIVDLMGGGASGRAIRLLEFFDNGFPLEVYDAEGNTYEPTGGFRLVVEDEPCLIDGKVSHGRWVYPHVILRLVKKAAKPKAVNPFQVYYHHHHIAGNLVERCSRKTRQEAQDFIDRNKNPQDYRIINVGPLIEKAFEKEGK